MENKESVNSAVFFISTGRCGTQFFADKLKAYYGDLAVVEHEPLRMDYKPVHYFSAYHSNDRIELTPVIERHVDAIAEILANSHYIETGWPVYGLLPYMFDRFKGRVKIVHLYRHPLKVAASLTTHNVYSRGEWSDALSISPAAHGVAQGYLAGQTWERMSEFEKCLFWWTEINHFALELHKRFPSIPWLSLRFEDVFSGDARSELTKLAGFLGFPERAGFASSTEEKTDRFSRRTTKGLDTSSLTDYPVATSVMEQLGYSFNTSVNDDINSRYKISYRDVWLGEARRMFRRLRKQYNKLTNRST